MGIKHIILIKPGILLGFFLCLYNLNAQYRYKLYSTGDPALAATSIAVFSTAFYMQHRVKPLSESVIMDLKIEDVNRFDRIACRQWNKDIALTSDIMAAGSGLMYLYFLGNEKSRSSAFNIGVVGFQSVMISQALANSFKLSLRKRPYLYNPAVPMSEKLKADSRFSFFSAHTSTVSALSFSFAFAHQTYIAGDRKNIGIWTGAAILPAIEGFLRIKAGKHYPSDVIFGYLAGLASSFLMHRMHKVRI